MTNSQENGWHWGLCWLCKSPSVLVSWIGSARTKYGDLDIFACHPCQVWWTNTALEQHSENDFAALAAR
jgi:hypothetical protein